MPDPTTILERVMRGPDQPRATIGDARGLERPTRYSGRVGIIILTSIVGFLAGVVGGLAAISIFTPLPPVFDGSILRRTRPSAATSMPPALAPIAASVIDFFAVEAKADAPSLLPLERRTGRGVALTSDGWIATIRAALPTQPSVRPIVVTADRKIRRIDRVAFDPISDLAFVHVSDLEASVLPLRKRAGLPVGLPLFAPTTDGGLRPLLLQAVTARIPSSAARSSERWPSVVALQARIGAPIGTPIIDGDGALVGIATDDEHALPVDAVISALPSLFAEGAVTRNALGVTYRDASEFAYQPDSVAEGVMLVRDGRMPAVKSTSPLAGKLAEGDAIFSVGDDSLTIRRSLAELIQEYPPGAIIELRVRREGTEAVVRVKLAAIVGESLLVTQPAAP